MSDDSSIFDGAEIDPAGSTTGPRVGGIFPRGAGQHAHFRRLVCLGMIALDSHGRDMNGEVERDVTIYRLTSEGRKIVQDAVIQDAVIAVKE